MKIQVVQVKILIKKSTLNFVFYLSSDKANEIKFSVFEIHLLIFFHYVR